MTLTTENKDRKDKLTDLSTKQETLINLITDIKDKYAEFQESSLLLSNLGNASDQLHKIQLLVASDKKSVTQVNESNPV